MMEQYACTRCTRWFQFEDLTGEKQLCLECISTSGSINKAKDVKKQVEMRRVICKYCQTDLKSKENGCERCLKNLKEHGKPKPCAYCKLNSAFIGSKCQRCSSSQKKYGPPLECSKCGSKSAFDHDKARVDGNLLCWLCYVTVQRKLRQAKRKLEQQDVGNKKVMKPSLSNSTSGSEVKEDGKRKGGSSNPAKKPAKESKLDVDLRRKAHQNSRRDKGEESGARSKDSLESRLADMKRTFSAPSSPSSSSPSNALKGGHNPSSNPSTPKSDTELPSVTSSNKASGERRWNGASFHSGLPTINDRNIVEVTKLREEIAGLKKQLARKDQQLIEKDKQLSLTKVEHLNEVKVIRTKFKSQEEDYIRRVETYRNKNQELLKKVAQISKGKASSCGPPPDLTHNHASMLPPALPDQHLQFKAYYDKLAPNKRTSART